MNFQFNETSNVSSGGDLVVPKSLSGIPEWSGYLLLVGCSFFWGSMYLPVKQFDTGDNFFYQLLFSAAMWIVGFFLDAVRQFPKFHIYPMLGGFIWTIGNLNCVYGIKFLGVGLTLVFANVLSLIVGWATARFGWFGLRAEVPTSPLMNYIGVSIAVISGISYIFVKPDLEVTEPEVSADEHVEMGYIEKKKESEKDNNNDSVSTTSREDFFDRLSLPTKRIIGFGFAAVNGIAFGEDFTGVVYMGQKENNDIYLDYLFSYYTGVFLSAFLIFIVYCMVKKNNPVLNPKLVLPGLLSGGMNSVATILYFLATSALSQSVTFPIANCGPNIFSNLWSIVVYKEIRGRRNIGILCSGFVMAIGASVLIGLSS